MVRGDTGRPGFMAHGLMGGVLLCGVWFALYLPHIVPQLRTGGTVALLALACGAIGGVVTPLLLVFDGDEVQGIAGLLAALLLGWVGAWIAGSLAAPPHAVESARLAGAALGPFGLCGGFWLRNRLAERRGSRSLAPRSDS